MKHLSNYLAATLFVIASGSAVANEHSEDFIKVNPEIMIQPSVGTRANTNIKINPKIVNAPGDDVNSVWFITKIDGKYNVYGMEDWKDGDEFAFYVPEGVYDCFAFGLTEDQQEVIFITKENVTIDNDFEGIVFNSADAVYSTSLSYLTPSGGPIILQKGKENQNTYRFDNIHLIFYEGVFLMFGNTGYFDEINLSVRSNFTSGKFSYAEAGFAANKEGMLQYIVPINFTEGEIIAGASNWQTGEINVAETPANFYYDSIATEDELPYTFASYGILQNNSWILNAGWGIFGEGYDARKLGFWSPENYDGELEMYAIPRGAVVKGYDSCINGLPVKRGENGLIQLGQNHLFDNYLVFSHYDTSFDNINLLYTGPLTDYQFGNCAPSLMTAKLWDRIDFNFAGRYCEAMNIDSWYNVFSMTDNFLTYEVKLTLNGNVITTDPIDYMDYEWEDEGLFTVEVTTDNILIDGEFPGVTTGTLTFDTESYGNVIPSVSVVSFFNATTGEITDRFASASEGVLGLYAAGFEFEVSKVTNFENYLLTVPEEVTVEYAPMGSGDYEELDVTELPEEFCSPGFGAYYEASLSGVKKTAPSGWYDLRITVTTENGASQTQEISPAFRILTDSGVKTVGSGKNDADVYYYNMQGQKVQNPSEGQLLIRRHGNKAEKVIF